MFNRNNTKKFMTIVLQKWFELNCFCSIAMMQTYLHCYFSMVLVTALLPLESLSSPNPQDSQRTLYVEGDCNPQLNIICVASCSHTSHCWGMGDEKNSYIRCFWNGLESNQNLQYSAFMQSSHENFCSPSVSCESKDESGKTTEICQTYIFANISECNFITREKNVAFAVEVLQPNDEPLCNSLARFSPCNIVKLDPPMITNISAVEQLEVSVSPPQCTENSWTLIKYKLKYFTFNGLLSSSERIMDITNPPFVLPLGDAYEYSLAAYSYVASVPEVLQVLSDPREAEYITAPIKAADYDFIDYQCMKHEGKFSIQAGWQKVGIISGFSCHLSERGSSETLVKYVAKNGSSSQRVFGVHFDNLIEASTYELSIVANNSAGPSRSTSMTIVPMFCDNSDKQPKDCVLASSDASWMEVAWAVPASSHSYNSFRVSISSLLANFTSNSLSKRTTRYKITGLQTCLFYTVSVESYYGAIKVGECTFQAYSKEIVPVDSPSFLVKDTSTSSISIEINNMSPSQSCGSVEGYAVDVRGRDHDIETITSSTRTVTNTGLDPYTNYSIMVAAVNAVGRGPFSKARYVMTNQAAPSTPPGILPLVDLGKHQYLVEWMQPAQPNGLISNYMMHINTSSNTNLEVSDEDCTLNEHTMTCLLEPTCFNKTIELHEGYMIQMQACTDKGLKCSEKSTPVTVKKSDSLPIIIAIILSCVALLSFTLATLYFCVVKTRGYKTKGPNISSRILDEFKNTPNNNVDEVISEASHNEEDGWSFKNETEITYAETYDSVNTWREKIAVQNSAPIKKTKPEDEVSQEWEKPSVDTTYSIKIIQNQESNKNDQQKGLKEDLSSKNEIQSLDGVYVCSPRITSFLRLLNNEDPSSFTDNGLHSPDDSLALSPTPLIAHDTNSNCTDLSRKSSSSSQEGYYYGQSGDSGVSSMLRHPRDTIAPFKCRHFFPSDDDVADYVTESPKNLVTMPRLELTNESVV